MTTQKKKFKKESQSNSTKNNEKYRQDKCPKNEKDCLTCKITDCPEER